LLHQLRSTLFPYTTLFRSIFDTFKTRNNKFTGEARRQRGIIAHLAIEQSPELRTRTSIAHIIADRHGILWQNIYSGIFRDLDERSEEHTSELQSLRHLVCR